MSLPNDQHNLNLASIARLFQPLDQNSSRVSHGVCICQFISAIGPTCKTPWLIITRRLSRHAADVGHGEKTAVVPDTFKPIWKYSEGTFGFKIDKKEDVLNFTVQLFSGSKFLGGVTIDVADDTDSPSAGQNNIFGGGSASGTVVLQWESKFVNGDAGAEEIESTQLHAQTALRRKKQTNADELERQAKKVAAVARKIMKDRNVGKLADHIKTRAAEAKKNNRAFRREIRDLPRHEQERFMNAILTMMKTKENGRNEYFEISKFHGWPVRVCVHRENRFPQWHRAYLFELEKRLQAADEENQKKPGAFKFDKPLAIPYWDPSRYDIEGEGLFPKILRDGEHVKGGMLPSDMPSKFIPVDYQKQYHGDRLLSKNGYIVPDDKDILTPSRASRARRTDLKRAVEIVLEQSDYDSARSNLENGHGNIHVRLNFPMYNTEIAAYHPIFYLHHCNVDRIYEAYLAKEKLKGSQYAVERVLRNEKWRWYDYERRRWYEKDETDPALTIPLYPFENPKTGKYFRVQDTFDTKQLGYEYDTLPRGERVRWMRQLPTLAVFDEVDVVGLAGKAPILHVFVVKHGTPFVPPGVTDDADGKGTKCESKATKRWGYEGHAFYSENYAASMGIFAGMGADVCVTCATKPKERRVVDLTAACNRLFLSRHEIDVVVFIEDLSLHPNDPVYLSRQANYDLNLISKPRTTGPLFEDPHKNLQKHARTPGKYHGENTALQIYLQKAGYGGHAVDGHFGPNTEAAVRAFQKFNGLKPDGIVGEITKGLMMRPRADYRPDGVGANWPYGKRTINGDVREVVVSVGEVPGYLERAETIEMIQGILKQWEQGVPFIFKLLYTAGKVRKEGMGPHQHAVNIYWSDTPQRLAGAKEDDVDVEFGVAGGCLAHADADGVIFDSAEMWRLPGTKRRKRELSFSLLTVMLHEFGHVLGLEHSKISEDVMSPYYIENQYELSPRDIQRVRDLYNPSADMIKQISLSLPKSERAGFMQKLADYAENLVKTRAAGEEKTTETTPPTPPATAAASAVAAASAADTTSCCHDTTS